MVDTQKNKQVNGCEQLGKRDFFMSLILTLIFFRPKVHACIYADR